MSDGRVREINEQMNSLIKTAIHHGLITLAWGLGGFIAGFVLDGLLLGVLAAVIWSACAAIGFYFGREVRQHEGHSEDSTLAWLDHITDVALPLAVHLGFLYWLGRVL